MLYLLASFLLLFYSKLDEAVESKLALRLQVSICQHQN